MTEGIGRQSAGAEPPDSSEFDDREEDVARIVRRFRRVRRWSVFGFTGLVVVLQVATYLTAGFLPFLVVSIGILAVFYPRLFRVRADVELVTDRSPAATREHFRRPVTVLTALTVPPDATITPVDVPGAVSGVDVEQRWWIFSGTVRLVVEEERSGPIVVTMVSEGTAVWTAEVRIAGGPDRSTVSVRTVSHRRLRPVQLLRRPIASWFQERVNDRLGFEEVAGDVRVGLR